MHLTPLPFDVSEFWTAIVGTSGIRPGFIRFVAYVGKQRLQLFEAALLAGADALQTSSPGRMTLSLHRPQSQ